MTCARTLLLTLVALFVSTAAASGQTSENTSQADGGPVSSFADAHVHLNDPEMQLRLMEESGNRRAIVFWGRNSTNEKLAAWAREHPGRFIPFASISPERATYQKYWDNNDTSLLAVLEGYLEEEVVRGIGEISVTHFPGRGFPEADYSPLHPLMRGIMDLAQKHGVPVNIHCEITRIREFEQLLDAYRDVTIIWAHGGYSPYYIARRMIATHPNLIYELSARTWRNHPRSPDYTIWKNDVRIWPRWLELIERNPDRFLVGTDASHHDLRREREKIESVVGFLGQLSPEAREAVAHGNFERLVTP